MQFRVGHLSIEVNIKDWASLETALKGRFAASEGFALATLNLDHLVKLQGKTPFREAYQAQDFITADGNPIVWCHALAGEAIDLMPGSDMILPLARLAAAEGVKLGFFGSSDDALSGAADYLRNAVPGLEIASMIAPPMGFDPTGEAAEAMLKDMGAAGVGLCFIALGAPKQELFAAKGRQIVPQMGFVSIGAGLDFFSGHQTRAPKWMRRIAMEWLWRLLQNPKRMYARYVLSFQILPGHMWRSFRQR